MDPSKLSTENIVATVIAGIGIGIIAIWKYVKELKAPTAPNGDRLVPGLSIADMTPFREIAADVKRLADAAARIAVIAEKGAEEDEIERRAIARSAEMVATEARRRRP